MARRLTYFEIANGFSEDGCQLISTDYIDARTPLAYRCSCGRESRISWDNFRKGKRCDKCGRERSAKVRRTPYSIVKAAFDNAGYELLSKEYVGANEPLEYRCKCGRKSTIIWNSFRLGNRCARCAGNLKHTLQEVYRVFKDAGCTCLATDYRNGHQSLPYICKCGNQSTISYSSFKAGHRCSKCSNVEKYTIEEVKQFFACRQCELLSSKYINLKTPLLYRCDLGKVHKIVFGNFLRGHKCTCRSTKIPYTIDSIRKYFRQRGCVLLANEYVNSRIKMPYICSCNNRSETSFHNFQAGKRCRKCSGKHMWEFRRASGNAVVETDIKRLLKTIKTRRKQLET